MLVATTGGELVAGKRVTNTDDDPAGGVLVTTIGGELLAGVRVTKTGEETLALDDGVLVTITRGELVTVTTTLLLAPGSEPVLDGVVEASGELTLELKARLLLGGTTRVDEETAVTT